MKPSRIQAVDHVNIEASPGLEEELRWFYGEVAELDEISSEAVALGGLCFKSEQIELRIRLAERPKIEAVACRVTLTVASLSDVAERLGERSVPFERRSGIAISNRGLQVLDPAGNRVEFKLETWVGPL